MPANIRRNGDIITAKRGSRWRKFLVGSGCAFWLIVLLTHVAERWRIFPGMGWGLPDSPGHYLDLVSAVAGALLLLAALVVRRS